MWGVLFQNAVGISKNMKLRNLQKCGLPCSAIIGEDYDGSDEKWNCRIKIHSTLPILKGGGGDVKRYCILIWILSFNAMWTHLSTSNVDQNANSVFKITNNDENVINPANLLSVWSTPQVVDHKDWRLAKLITFSSLLLILNTLRCILIHIWSR